MSSPGRHRDHHVARKRRVRAVSFTAGLVTLAMVLGTFLVYRHLDGNITALDTTDALGNDRPEKVEVDDGPHEPLNILLLGSDTREGANGNVGGETPGLSDTTILLHLSADRERAYGVSLPRDAMVERPECLAKNGETDPGGLSMFNAAYAVGGPGCTQKTVEQLTGIRIDHFVVVDFSGFKHMVDALGGVPVCVPEEVNDDYGDIYLPAGSYEASGNQALDYVRVRNAISNNGDIGRMRRQQTFLAAMANKAISAGTLANPPKLIKFLDAATSSLTTDPELASLKNLMGLANELRGIGLDQIQFLTVPWEWYEPDPNRVAWAPESAQLWRRLRNDLALTPALSKEITTAAEAPSTSPAPSGEESSAGAGQPSNEESHAGSGQPQTPGEDATSPEQPAQEDAQREAEKAASAAENGLCA